MASGTSTKARKVYAGPGSSYVLLGELPAKSEFEIIRKEGSYYVISCNLGGRQTWGFTPTTGVKATGTVPTIKLTSTYSLTHQTPIYAGPGYNQLDYIVENAIIKAFNQTDGGYQYVEFETDSDKSIRGYIPSGCLYETTDVMGHVKKEINIYHTISEDTEPIGKVGPRQTVKILNKPSSGSLFYFVECRLSNNGELVRGYIRSGSVSPKIGTTKSLSVKKKCYVLDRNATIYTGPGRQYKQADTMDANEIVEEWDESTQENGYSYVEFYTSATSTNAAEVRRGYVETSAIYRGTDRTRAAIKTAKSYYSGPSSTGYTKLGQLGPYQYVDVICKESGYYELDLKYGNGYQTRGYISSASVEWETGEIPIRSVTKDYRLAKMSEVLSGPNYNYDTVSTTDDEQIVETYGYTEGNFTLIGFENGSAGKVRGYFPTNMLFDDDEKIMAVVTADGKKVYSYPSSSNGAEIDTLNKGLQVEIIHKEGTYYMIEYDGVLGRRQRGYIYSANLSYITGTAQVVKAVDENITLHQCRAYSGPDSSKYTAMFDFDEESIVTSTNIVENGYVLAEYLDEEKKKHRVYVDTNDILVDNTIMGVMGYDRDIRALPDTQSEIVGQVAVTQQVKIIYKDGGYYYIEFEDKTTGALGRGYVKTTSVTQIVGEPEVIKVTEETRLVRATQAYFGPGAAYMSAHPLEDEAIVQLLTNVPAEKGYRLIAAYDANGEEFRAYVLENTLQTAISQPIALTSSAATLYAGPGTSYDKLGKTPIHKKVRLIFKEGSYYCIDYTDDQTKKPVRGFVSGSTLEYIMGEAPTRTNTLTPSLVQQATLLSGPNTSYGSLYQLPADSFVAVCDYEENGYTMVECLNPEVEIRAYVESSKLFMDNSKTIGIVKAAGSWVYTGPDGTYQYSMLGKLPAYTKVTILAQEGKYSWLEIDSDLLTEPKETFNGTLRCYMLTENFKYILGKPATVLEKAPINNGRLCHAVQAYCGPGAAYSFVKSIEEGDIVNDCNYTENGYALVDVIRGDYEKKGRAFVPAQMLYDDAPDIFYAAFTAADKAVYPSTVAVKQSAALASGQKCKAIYKQTATNNGATHVYTMVEFIDKATNSLMRGFVTHVSDDKKILIGEAPYIDMSRTKSLVHACNVYNGPGTNYKVVGSLNEGDSVSYYNKYPEENGYRLLLFEDANGTTHKAYIPSIALYEDPNKVVGMVTDEETLYSGPGSKYTSISQIGPNQNVDILYKEGSYYAVECTPDGSNTMLRGYIATSKVSAIYGNPVTKAVTGTYKMAHETVGYAGPGMEYLEHGQTDEAMIVKALDLVEDGYTAVEMPQSDGQICRTYIPNDSLYIPDKAYGLLEKSVDIYAGPSASKYVLLGQNTPEQPVEITCAENGFYVIDCYLEQIPEKVRGYVAKSHISQLVGTPIERTVEEALQLAAKSSAFTGPNTNYYTAGELYEDDIVTVLNVAEGPYTLIERYDFSDTSDFEENVGGAGQEDMPENEPEAVALEPEQTVSVRRAAKSPLKMASAAQAVTLANAEANPSEDTAPVTSALNTVNAINVMAASNQDSATPQAMPANDSPTNKLAKLRRGYIPNKYLKLGATAQMASASTTYHGPSDKIYAILGSVSAGERVVVRGAENGWFYICYPTASGYKAGYVPMDKVKNGEELSHIVGNRRFTGHAGFSVNTDTRVYSGPDNKRYEHTGTVYADESITVFDQESTSNCVYVEYSTPDKTKRGYIPKSALVPERAHGVLGYIQTDGSAPVFAGPDSNYHQNGKVYNDEYVVILGAESDAINYSPLLSRYYYVEFNSPAKRKRGYIAKDQVVLLQPLNTVGTEPKSNGLARLTENTPVYSGPGLQFSTVGSVHAGERVQTFKPLAADGQEYTGIEYYTGKAASKRGYVKTSQLAPMVLQLPAIDTAANVTKSSYGNSPQNHPLDYYKIGNGANSLIAIFGVHGYEDAWAADGEELYKIAGELIQALAADQAGGAYSDWSIYIVPTANPDGLLDGYTNNGFGRAAYDNYDMNRIWPKGEEAEQRFLNRREYNITDIDSMSTPLENIWLYNAINAWKSKNGQTVLLDVHGWLNESFGDKKASVYYDNALSLPHIDYTADSGHGYLTRWAQQSKEGMHAALIELPKVTSPQDVVDKHLSASFITATRNLLQNALTELVLPTKIESIKIRNPRKTKLKLNQKLTLKADILPVDHTETIQWLSSDPEIATVQMDSHDDGLSKATVQVQSKKGGAVTITCQSADGRIQDSLTFNVAITATKITIQAANLDDHRVLHLNQGEETQLSIHFEPSDATTTMKDIIWSVFEPTVAEIDQNGKLKTNAAFGETIITAQVNGTNVLDSIMLVANAETIPVQSVSIDEQSVTVDVGDSKQLAYTVLPENATNKAVKWSSSDTSCVTVSGSGKIKGRKAGTATITCTTVDGKKTATIQVNAVKVPVTSITLNKTELHMNSKTGVWLKATIEPENATNKKLIWSSSDTEIASVLKITPTTCLVTAGTVKGQATIQCKIEGETPTATATVHVTVQPESVDIVVPEGTHKPVLLQPGQTLQLSAKVYPDNAENKTIQWKSTDTSRATVTDNGLVTIKDTAATGIVTIQAQVKGTVIADGLFIAIASQAEPLDGIELSPQVLTLKTREAQEVMITCTPFHFIPRAVTFSHSDDSVLEVRKVFSLNPSVLKFQVTALKNGSDTLTFTVSDKDKTMTATLPVTVQFAEAQDIVIENGADVIQMDIDDSQWIKAAITPADTVDQTTTWQIDNPTIAQLVNQSTGSLTANVTTPVPEVEIKGLQEGRVTLTATTGSKQVQDSIIIHVLADLTIPTPGGSDEESIEIVHNDPMMLGDHFEAKAGGKKVAGTWKVDALFDRAFIGVDQKTGEVTKVRKDVTATVIFTPADGSPAIPTTVNFAKKDDNTGNDPGSDNKAQVEGTVQNKTTMYAGPGETLYVAVEEIDAQTELIVFHQEGDWYYVELKDQKLRGYLPASQVEADVNVAKRTLVSTDRHVGRKQNGYKQEPIRAYYGPNSSYRAAADTSGSMLDYCEDVLAFDWEEAIDNGVNYTFIEYYVNQRTQKKRAYIETSLIWNELDFDDVHYVHGPKEEAGQIIYGDKKEVVYSGFRLSQGFNEKHTNHRGHLGYDLVKDGHSLENPPDIVSIFPGEIVLYYEDLEENRPPDRKKKENPNGNCIIIRHDLGNGTPVFYSCYGHLKTLESSLHKGSKVDKNTKLGTMGTSGNVNLHLHLAVFAEVDGIKLSERFFGYSNSSQHVEFENSGNLAGTAKYDYNGYFFDGPIIEPHKTIFYDPLAVIYTKGGVIKNHPPN